MGNVSDGVVKNTIAVGCSSDIDPTLFDHRSRAKSLHKAKKHHLTAPPNRQRRSSTASDRGIRFKSTKSKHRELDRRRGRANRRRRGSITSIRSENDTKHSTEVVEQLISLGYGTEKECYQASALTRNYRDINDVLKKLKEIQSLTIKHRDSNDKKIIQTIHHSLTNSPLIKTEKTNDDDYPFLRAPNDDTDTEDDEFKMDIDLRLQESVSLQDINEHPTFASSAQSEPFIPMKSLRSPRFELRNSISATSPDYHIKKVERIQAEMRQSIESTLSEMAENKQETDNTYIGVSVYTVNEPPLLPAIPSNLVFWKDVNNDRQCVICCTGHRMFHSGYKPGVYLYDLNGYNVEYLVSYPDNVYANCLSLSMDNNGDKLHLFGGKGLFGQWLTLDINAKLWNIRKDLSKYRMPFGLNMEHLKCIVIDANLHIYCGGRFLRYNRRKHRFIELDAIVMNGVNVKNIEYMFYVAKQRRIYAFGANDYHNIWFCQHNESFTQYKWYIMDIQLPYNDVEICEYDAVLAFEHILFVFYHIQKTVCCIDLVKERISICDKVIVEGGVHSKIINTDTNIAHSLCMDHNGATHIVIRLNDILESSSVLSIE